MTDTCFQLLPPYVGWLATKEKINLSNFRKAVRNVGLSPEIVGDDTLTRWAYNIAVTRSFEVNGDRKIVPMADMFNHDTETEVELSYDEQGNCMAYTTKDVRAGSPLRISYADPTNPSPFLATYGFLDETSPASFCKIMDMQQEMETLGIDFSRMLFYKDTGEISEEVWDVVLYKVLAEDPNLQQGFYEAYMNGDLDTKNSYHNEYFPYTYELLKTHVEGTLKQLTELQTRAYDRGWTQHPRIPLILKHNEFVYKTFSNVQTNLESMMQVYSVFI